MQKRLEEWLFTPLKTRLDKTQLVLTAFLFNLVWLFSIVALLRFINESEWQYGAIFYACLMAPLWEEFAFRVLPVAVAKIVDERLILPVLGISILLFGWGHGDGTNSLLIQGVGGVFLSLVYIKSGYSYWSAVALHAIWNTFVIFGPYLFR